MQLVAFEDETYELLALRISQYSVLDGSLKKKGIEKIKVGLIRALELRYDTCIMVYYTAKDLIGLYGAIMEE